MLTRTKTTFWEPNRAVKAAQLFGKIDSLLRFGPPKAHQSKATRSKKLPVWDLQEVQQAPLISSGF